jgi:hypothetical protein
MQRAVAQLGSALDWGSRGRGFKSRQPDHVSSNFSRKFPPKFPISEIDGEAHNLLQI